MSINDNQSLADIRKSVSEMTTEKLQQQLLEIRQRRFIRAKAKTPQSKKSAISSQEASERLALLMEPVEGDADETR